MGRGSGESYGEFLWGKGYHFSSKKQYGKIVAGLNLVSRQLQRCGAVELTGIREVSTIGSEATMEQYRKRAVLGRFSGSVKTVSKGKEKSFEKKSGRPRAAVDAKKTGKQDGKTTEKKVSGELKVGLFIQEGRVRIKGEGSGWVVYGR